jgi:hypothetical protein
MIRPANAHGPSPTTRAETARRNGALSRGPATAEGKARSARNATRHGLSSGTLVPRDGNEAAELAALRAALLARHQPWEAAEAHWVEELACVTWRQRRLRALEAAVLARTGEAGSAEAQPVLPSLATVARYRARLERERRRAGEELAALRRQRPSVPEPAQLSSAGSPTGSSTSTRPSPPPPPPRRHVAGTERRRLAWPRREIARTNSESARTNPANPSRPRLVRAPTLPRRPARARPDGPSAADAVEARCSRKRAMRGAGLPSRPVPAMRQVIIGVHPVPGGSGRG